MAKKPEVVAEPAMSSAEALAEISKGLRMFKAFEHAEKVCALLANVDQVTVERQKAAAMALAQSEDAKKRNDAAVLELEALLKKRDAAKADAEQAASGAFAAVQTDLQRLRNQAASDAAEFAKQKQDAEDELSSLRLLIQSERKALSDAEKSVADFKARARDALK
jgi:hypothetical protein